MKTLAIIAAFLSLVLTVVMILFASQKAEPVVQSCCSKNSDANHGSCEEQHKSDSRTAVNSSDTHVCDDFLDLELIDKNKDGKLFHCPMHLNMISDKKESCPVCDMPPVELTIEKIGNGFVEHGLKVKKNLYLNLFMILSLR